MAKGPKSSKEDDTVSKASSVATRDGSVFTPHIENPDEVAKEVENADIKSVAESDTGKLCGDVLSNMMSQNVSETDYNEPSLNDVIVESYEGGKSQTGHFDGYGEALFVGGNKYAGLFLGGVMHGKGKYTWVDGSVYDGDMNNNHISGYGRYEWNDESYYEGEVSNGMRHGVGVFKSPKHDVSYSGQWYLGKRHGRGIMHYSNHSWYEGDWLNNTRHGWGVRRYHTGNVYEGQWVNDKRHGDGTMRWLTSDESYNGMWENGVQHGLGTHTWYLNRVPGSQYPLRNEYVGDFVNGLRHGHGKFFFASGAVYDGEWENNKKHGWGKFVFKNGKVFEGQFENDYMVNYPNFRMDGSKDFEGNTTRTRTPVGWEDVDNEAVKNRGNVLGPSFNLDIDFLLDEFPEDQREMELNQVTSLVLRNLSVLRRVYSFYSALGHDKSPDNTFVMTRFQFWRFLKDCLIHHHNLSLSQMDRSMARCHDISDIHNPMEKLLLREFLTTCVSLSFTIFKEEEKSKDVAATKKSGLICRCLERLIDEHIMKHSCRVGGHFLKEPRHAVCALAYMDRSWHIYQRVCTRRKLPPYEQTFTMRQFLFLLKDLKIIGPQLNTKSALQILSSDDPSVSDGESCNMDIEMTFLEFFEALIGIAVNYVSNDVIQSSVVNEEQQTRFSRPTSSVSQSVSEVFPTNHVVSTEALSQVDEDRCGDASKHSMVSNPVAVENAAGFLRTLSQLSIQDDLVQIPEETLSLIQQDSQPNFAEETEPVDQTEQAEAEVETSPEEDEFNTWSGKLEKFFVQLLFPAWSHQENVRSQVLKDKADLEEQQRIHELHKEAERRRRLVNEEIPPTPPPEEQETLVQESKEPVGECGSAGPDILVVEAALSEAQTRQSSSATSVQTTKSTKGKRRR